MASSNGNSKRSEDVYGQKIDRCLYNALIKFVGGVGVGIVFSALLFKRKPWPVLLGVGVGMGMGISDCNHEFRGPVKVKTTGFLINGEILTLWYCSHNSGLFYPLLTHSISIWLAISSESTTETS